MGEHLSGSVGNVDIYNESKRKLYCCSSSIKKNVES